VTAAPRGRSAFGKVLLTLFLLLLAAGIGVAAFFGGMWKQRRDNQAQAAQTPQTPAPTPTPAASEFDRKRHEVDQAPAKMALHLSSEQGNQPMSSSDPEFLYLYGRALLLSGKYAEASAAFNKAAEILKDRPARDQLKIETKLSAAVAAMKSGTLAEQAKAATAIDEVIDKSPPPDSSQTNNSANQFATGRGGAGAAPIEMQP
jgi:tetratricopeptide (TPR) repeat protein